MPSTRPGQPSPVSPARLLRPEGPRRRQPARQQRESGVCQGAQLAGLGQLYRGQQVGDGGGGGGGCRFKVGWGRGWEAWGVGVGVGMGVGVGGWFGWVGMNLGGLGMGWGGARSPPPRLSSAVSLPVPCPPSGHGLRLMPRQGSCPLPASGSSCPNTAPQACGPHPAPCKARPAHPSGTLQSWPAARPRPAGAPAPPAPPAGRPPRHARRAASPAWPGLGSRQTSGRPPPGAACSRQRRRTARWEPTQVGGQGGVRVRGMSAGWRCGSRAGVGGGGCSVCWGPMGVGRGRAMCAQHGFAHAVPDTCAAAALRLWAAPLMRRPPSAGRAAT